LPQGEPLRTSRVPATEIMKIARNLRYLEDRWDVKVAQTLDAPELLRYRSNLLGPIFVLRISEAGIQREIQEVDPLDGSSRTVL